MVIMVERNPANLRSNVCGFQIILGNVTDSNPRSTQGCNL